MKLKINWLIPIQVEILFIYLFITLSTAAQENQLKIDLPYGSYQIGFKVIHTYDSTRSYSEKYHDSVRFRPMQIAIWYPSKATGKGFAMKYEDYFFLKAHESGKVNLTEEKKQQIIKELSVTDQIPLEKIREEIQKPVMAIQEPEPELGKFPVIIYGPSWWSTAFENAILFEFLASHGYVVISSPSMGPQSREMPLDRIGMETQARDLEFLVNQAFQFPPADPQNLAIAGFSFGGLSNVITLARSPHIDAWIGIDPTIHEAYQFFKESPYEDYSKFQAPMLFVNSAGYMNDLPFYEKLVYSDAYLVNLSKMDHTDMASQFIRFQNTDDQRRQDIQSKGYNLMADYILKFIDGVFLNKHYTVMQEDVFDLQGLDTTFITIASKQGLLQPDRLFMKFKGKSTDELTSFMANFSNSDGSLRYPEADVQKLIFLAKDRDTNLNANEIMLWYKVQYPGSFPNKLLNFMEPDILIDMFHEIYSYNKKCNFDYYEINHTGHVLFMGGNGEKGLEYFKLNAFMRPDNYQAHFNLGVGYFWLEDFQNATLHFNKCLALEPDDRYQGLARDFLSKLD